MAEYILGIGNRKSVREIVSHAERQLSYIEGAPRWLTVTSQAFTVDARRAEFTGPFQTYTLRIPSADPSVTDLKEAAAEYEGVCRISSGEDWEEFSFSSDGDSSELIRSWEAVDRLSECLTFPEVWRVRGDDFRVDPISTELMFQAMVRYRASDLHLSPGISPVFRVDGEIRGSEIMGVLSAVQISELIRRICGDQEWEEFQELKQTSFNFHQVGIGYSRVSAFVKNGAPHCTFRFLPEVVPSFEELNIPGDTMKKLADMHHGLLLVTGMTGSGKSTTLAAIVDWINSNKSLHILSIENPVEYVHKSKRAVISQRTTGKDVRTFGEAVTGALRHDPDVLVIGEMRDPDTIRSAINAAATGHLVISTLHSNTASEVVNRIISFFDPVERDLVRLQLRDCMRCVICQRLIPRVGGGRVPALEFMFNDIKPISDGIIMGDTDLIRIGMQQSVSHSFLFEEYLNRLVKNGTIELEQARLFATEVSMLDQMIMGTYSIPRLDSLKAAHDMVRH